MFNTFIIRLEAQQSSLNRFVKEYNHVKPHEFLGMKTPADCHDFFTRPYPEKIPNYDYSSTMKVMKVCQNGPLRWKSINWVFLTSGLKGKHIGVEYQKNRIWRVFYREVFLGYFNEKKIRDKQVSIRLSQNLV